MNIQLLGDLHGHVELLPALLQSARMKYNIKAALQVGDFGFYKGVSGRIPPLPVPVYAFDGNHEDHRLLALAVAQKLTAFGSRGQITYRRRSEVFTLGGVSIGCIGGALNADRSQESENHPNWVTDGDVDRAAYVFNAEQPEIILAHSCPHSIGVGMKANKNMAYCVASFCEGFNTGPMNDCGEPGLTRLWERLTYRPKLWLFGHFHRFHRATVDGCRFVCVGSSDGSDGQETPLPVILDVEALTITRHRRTL